MDDKVNLANEEQLWRYDIVSKLLHWIIAILLIGLIILGWYMMSIEDNPSSSWYFALHKSFGLVAAMFILMRLIWRFFHRHRRHTNILNWEKIAARSVHWLLYVTMIFMPITGFIGASFSKHGVAFFGLQLPAWVNKKHTIAQQFFWIHEVLAWLLVVLIIIHVLAALKHLIINKDKVFQRMWF